MIHVGHYIKKRLENTMFKKSAIADAMGISKQNMNRFFNQEDIGINKVIALSNIIDIDLLSEIASVRLQEESE